MAESARKLGLVTAALATGPLTQFPAAAREAEELGYTTLWTPEVTGPDALITLTACALNTSKIELATGVLPIQIRSPGAMAMSFLTLNELSCGRAVAGLGVSSPIIVERWHGARYQRPITAMRECVTIMRQLFTENRSKFDGKVYKSDFRLGFKATQNRPPRIYIAALNPPMLRLAGELADGVLLNYSPPEAISEMVAEVHRGAAAAGRDQSSVDIAIFIRMCITDDEPRALDAFRRELSTYAFVDAYNKMFSRYGMTDEMAEVRRLWKEGKREQAADAISETSARKIAAFGPASSGREYVARFRTAGVLNPVIFPIGPSNTVAQDFANTMRALAGA